jgi:hypothetical protein
MYMAVQGNSTVQFLRASIINRELHNQVTEGVYSMHQLDS